MEVRPEDDFYREKPVEVRCSSLPRIFACPGSLNVKELDAPMVQPAADYGTACHAAMAKVISKGLTLEDGLAALKAECIRMGVKYEEYCLKAMYFWWRENCKGLEKVKVERSMAKKVTDNLTLTGTCDVCAQMGNKIVIIDWKTGSMESSYARQVQGYAWLALKRGVKSVVCVTMYARLGYATTEEYSVDELKAFVKDLVEVLNSTALRMSDFCGYCKSAAFCPARKASMVATKKDLAIFTNEDADAVAALASDPAKMVAMMPSVDAVANACEAFKYLFRTMVENTPGGIDNGDGRQWVLRNEDRVSCDLQAARATLEEMGVFDKLEISASATALKKAFGKEAATNMAKLEDSGYLTHKTVQKLALVKKEKED